MFECPFDLMRAERDTIAAMRIALLLVLVAACGDDGGTTKKDGGPADSPVDTKLIDARPIDAPVDGPPGTYPLTVKNTLVWCELTVNNGAPSSAAQQVVNVAPGVIQLKAEPLQGFILGLWHHTDGDTGSGHPGNVGYGAPLDTVVTWALARTEKGTRLRLVHSGFVTPLNDSALKTMGEGWKKVVPRIGGIAGTLH